jgi:hypothetical protein
MESPAVERRLIRPMRAILYAGGFFVLVAGLQLWILADRTDELFAWTIDSRMSAAFIGSFYWSAAVLALLSAREQSWARARLGVPGVLAFVWLTLLATLLHLDLFHLDEGGFMAQAAAWVWLAIYVIEPPVLLWAFVVQLRAPGDDPPRTDPLPAAYRGLLAGLATVLILFGAALFIAPLEVAEAWPWTLTELTGRAIAAWLVAAGGLLAAMRWENDRSRIRLGTYLPVTFVALASLALARFGEEVDWSSAAAMALLAALAALLVAGLWGWRISTG